VQSTRSLTERRITHIASVCTEPIPVHHPQSGIRYLRVTVEDQDLLIWMPHTCRFIYEALRTGSGVLVHGVHGLSRGATIMTAYSELDGLLLEATNVSVLQVSSF
jgi:dual specificity phosphatase 12